MQFRKVQALRGPNIWAAFPVLEAWVDLGRSQDGAPAEWAGVHDRLRGWFPSLGERETNGGEPEVESDAGYRYEEEVQ